MLIFFERDFSEALREAFFVLRCVETMSRQEWNVEKYQGQEGIIEIYDGFGDFGHINVDDFVTSVHANFHVLLVCLFFKVFYNGIPLFFLYFEFLNSYRTIRVTQFWSCLFLKSVIFQTRKKSGFRILLYSENQHISRKSHKKNSVFFSF